MNYFSAALLLALSLALPGAQAQAPAGPALPVTPQQRAIAQQVAQAGVPLSELAAGAPDEYTVKPGDTLWGIAGLYLRSPWRWPELWGMNLPDIRNPHLIFPGQRLELTREGDRARLRVAGPPQGGPPPTVRLSPRTRAEPLADPGLPTLQPHLIEPFLAEPVVVAPDALERAPRLVAAADQRVLIARGDRAYARGPAGAPLTEPAAGTDRRWVVVRATRVLRDPVSGEVLGHEAQTLGRGVLVRGEAPQASPPVAASLDIVNVREEIRAGDRLLPEPARPFVSYVPRAPEVALPGAAVAAVYGTAVSTAGPNQVVAINKGAADGLASGHVLRLLRSGQVVVDRAAPDGERRVQLPDEHNGLLMVFRVFDRVAYALVLETVTGVRVGDRLAPPR